MLDGQERPDLTAAGADDPDRPRHEQQPEVVGQGEQHPGESHEQGAGDEHPPPAEPVRHRGQPEGEARVAQEDQGQEHADLARGQADLAEVEDEDDRQAPVGDQADAPRREQEPAVGRQRAEGVGGEVGRHGVAGVVGPGYLKAPSGSPCRTISRQ
jgi:hypothetical protein